MIIFATKVNTASMLIFMVVTKPFLPPVACVEITSSPLQRVSLEARYKTQPQPVENTVCIMYAVYLKSMLL